MTRVLTLAAALAITAGVSTQSEIAGSWTMSFPNGSRPAVLDLRLDGQKVSGTFAGSTVEGEFKEHTLTCADPVNWAAWRAGTIGGADAREMYATVMSATMKEGGTLSGWSDVFIRGYGAQPIKRMSWAATRAKTGSPAQEKPSFTGSWVASSAAHAPQRLRIAQDASQLTVTELSGTRQRTLVYQLDGSESRNETRTVTGEKWTHVSHAKWVTSALTITTTTTRESSGGSWDWMTIYLRDGTGNLKVTTLDAVTDPGPFVSMAQSTVIYAKEPPTQALAGRWTVSFTGPAGEGPKTFAEVILDLSVDGQTLTGTATMADWPGLCPVSEGRIDGDHFSFVAIGSLWSSSGYPRTTFEGTIRGDELMLTITRGYVGDSTPGRKLKMEGKKIRIDR